MVGGMFNVRGRSEPSKCLPHPPSSREINFNAEHAIISNSGALTEKLEYRNPFEFIIPDQASQTTSTTVHELSEALELHKKANEGGYLWVPFLSKSAFKKILSDQDLFRSARATICRASSQIVYRMVGPRHEVLSRTFENLVTHSLSTMLVFEVSDHFKWLGASRYEGKHCAKEPDGTFVPGNVDVDAGWVPSMVIETGYSESLPQLRNDAPWWYSNTDEQTKMIILIHADKKPTWNVTVEMWEEVNVHDRPSTRRSGPSRDIRCTQRACVTNNGVVGDDIVIDFALLMRRAPRPPVEGNITLDANLLQRLR